MSLWDRIGFVPLRKPGGGWVLGDRKPSARTSSAPPASPRRRTLADREVDRYLEGLVTIAGVDLDLEPWQRDLIETLDLGRKLDAAGGVIARRHGARRRLQAQAVALELMLEGDTARVVIATPSRESAESALRLVHDELDRLGVVFGIDVTPALERVASSYPFDR